MARLNPNPASAPAHAPSPRACSAPVPASAGLESTYTPSSPTSSRAKGSQTSSGDVRAGAEQDEEREQIGASSRSLLDECRKDKHRPRLIIARVSRAASNLTLRKKRSPRKQTCTPDLAGIYPFLENVVVVEVPEDSESDADSEREEGVGYENDRGREAYMGCGGGEESSLFETEVEGQTQRGEQKSDAEKKDSEEDKSEDEDEDAGDSAYGSFNIELPEAACPTFITREDSLWTYSAICAWRDAVCAGPPSPSKALPSINVRKRLTPRTLGKSPGKRLLTF
ncbi:hypothetical protein PMIN03_011460 [Paraphaeosphaeria minitans]